MDEFDCASAVKREGGYFGVGDGALICLKKTDARTCPGTFSVG